MGVDSHRLNFRYFRKQRENPTRKFVQGEFSLFIFKNFCSENLFSLQDLLDKALLLNSEEFTLLHMSGRLAYSVASLSWVERKLASTLFGEPPVATMDEAIEKFERVTELKSDWIENFLYLAKAYIAKDAKANRAKLVEALKRAVAIEPINASERSARDEAAAFLKKYSK